jgi:RimJ/RimL family protein N-acetyltransferase
VTTSVEITTTRLFLRHLAVSDSAAVLAYRADPDVARHQPWRPRDEDEVIRWIRSQESAAVDTPGTWFQLAILLREGGALIGDVGLHFPAEEPRQAEFGITLAPGFQRRGCATEALRAVLRYLAADLRKHRVYARVDPRNARSIALLERVGMRREGHLRESCLLHGEWADDYVYAILDREIQE